MNKYLIVFLLCSGFAISQNKADSLPVLTDSVNDYEDLFQVHQELILKESVESFYEESGIGITIVTVESINPYDTIFKFSLDLANASTGKVLIVVSRKLRQIQIQNSDSILDKLTNEETKTILDKIILPKFKEGDYFRGLLNGVMEIKKELN